MVPDERMLTRLLRDEGVTLAVARSIYEEAGGGEAGAVAARRYMDTELRALAPWPSNRVYEAVAGNFADAGQDRTGELLQAIARAGERLEKAEQAWQSRYANRGPLAAEQMAAALRRDADVVSWDPVGPYAGIDGAQYYPGSMNLAYHVEPVVIAEGRGTTEVITGWANFDDMHNWIATRGTGGSRALTPPPVPSATRTWMEDTVLAYILNWPFVPETFRALSADAMTTDVRWEVFAAARRLSGIEFPRNYTPEAIIAETKAKLAYVPADGLSRYGGADGPFIRAYVSRLAETSVHDKDFRSAVQMLHHEDLQAKRRLAVMEAPSSRTEPRDALIAETPETCPELSPGHVSGPHPGPVPGR